MNLSVVRASIRASPNSWRPLYVLRMDGRMNTPYAETTLKGRGRSERRTSANFATLIVISFYYQFYVLGCDGDLTCSCESLNLSYKLCTMATFMIVASNVMPLYD